MVLHPGEIIKKDYLKKLGISPYQLSKSIKIQQTHITKLLNGDIGISAEMALRLSKYFDNSPEYWLNLQDAYKIEEVRKKKGIEINKIEAYNFQTKIIE